MNTRNDIHFYQSMRTTAPLGQVALSVKVPAEGDYQFAWCVDSGTLSYPFLPCDPTGGDSAEQTGKRRGSAKTTAKKAARSQAGDQLESYTETGPTPHAELLWQAPQAIGLTYARVDVFQGGNVVASHQFPIEVTPNAVPEVFMQAVEHGFKAATGPRSIKLERSDTQDTPNQPLWVAIRDRTRAVGFSEYKAFVDQVLCGDEDLSVEAACDHNEAALKRLKRVRNRQKSDICHGVDAYELLKTTTEVFLILHCGVNIDRQRYEETANRSDEARRLGRDHDFGEIVDRLAGYLGNGRLPYIQRIVAQNFSDQARTSSKYCEGLIEGRLDCPCLIELLWSYWKEEGSLVQTLNAISLRFQNKRFGSGRDPLAALEIDPLRPLNNLLWGYIQGERERLTIGRRAYEYDHHYGLRLVGKAVPHMRPADSRSKFLEAYHSLLHRTALFFQEDADTTVIADGFPLLNALKEVHLLLAEGAHNQYGDLPWTARAEMLMQEWILARPEIRDFLRGRAMVPYQEPWMGQVDTMRRLQGWDDTPITHFRNLAVYGEQLLLSIRFDDWIDANDQDYARNWARYWRPEVQGYIHAYRAVTGVDLSAGDSRGERVDATLPAVHLQRRLASQRSSRG